MTEHVVDGASGAPWRPTQPHEDVLRAGGVLEPLAGRPAVTVAAVGVFQRQA